jgi:predicted metal-dependent enzyme (double-stranded beta helix superfamily)
MNTLNLTRPTVPSARTNTASKALSADDLAALIRPLADDSALWRHLAEFNSEGRWWRRLHESADVDIWLLTWLRGHHTDLHDHGGSAGAFAVVQGSLTEMRVIADRRSTMHRLVLAGNAVAVAPTTVHDVFNASDTPAISLHAYSPPLSSMGFYDLGADGLTFQKSSDTHESSLDAA